MHTQDKPRVATARHWDVDLVILSTLVLCVLSWLMLVQTWGPAWYGVVSVALVAVWIALVTWTQQSVMTERRQLLKAWEQLEQHA